MDAWYCGSCGKQSRATGRSMCPICGATHLDGKLVTPGIEAPNTFECRQCGQLHELTPQEIAGRRDTPWKRICTCGAQYQITFAANRLIAWGPGYTPPRSLPSLPLLPLPLPLITVILPLPPLNHTDTK